MKNIMKIFISFFRAYYTLLVLNIALPSLAFAQTYNNWYENIDRQSFDTLINSEFRCVSIFVDSLLLKNLENSSIDSSKLEYSIIAYSVDWKNNQEGAVVINMFFLQKASDCIEILSSKYVSPTMFNKLGLPNDALQAYKIIDKQILSPRKTQKLEKRNQIPDAINQLRNIYGVGVGVSRNNNIFLDRCVGLFIQDSKVIFGILASANNKNPYKINRWFREITKESKSFEYGLSF